MSAEAAIAAYHRAIEADPEASAEQAAWLVEAFERAGISFAGAPMRSFLRPHLVVREQWDRLRGAGRRLLELAARVARSAFDDDPGRLTALLGIPEAELPWVALDPGEPDVLWSRLDAFLTSQGPRFIEINSDAPAGFGYGDRMAEVFAELPLFREFARSWRPSYQPSASGLVDAALSLWRARGGRDRPTVAIVDWAEVGTRPDQELLRRAFAARGLSCFLADPRELERSGGRLRRGDDVVDLVFRRGLLQELVAREIEARPLLDAYREREAVFFNSFRCRLSENKAFFAVLTDESFAGLLSDEERGFLSRVLPWTRRLEERRTQRRGRQVDLVPHVLEHREELVLKPSHDYGGRSVHVGRDMEPAAWQRAVEAAFATPWVVQERVEVPEEPFPVVDLSGALSFEPLKLNANPFYVRDVAVGAVARASREAVINVSAGGGSVPSFVLEG